MLGSGGEERGVQETLTEAEKLELIKAKFVTRLCLYGSRGDFLGEAVRADDGNFVYIAPKLEKVCFWSLGPDTSPYSLTPVRPFKQPVYVNGGDTFTIEIDLETT